MTSRRPIVGGTSRLVMIAIGLLFLRMLCDYFKSRRRLGAEILVLRHQLNTVDPTQTQLTMWRALLQDV
jgi:hypothetical protein